MALNTVTYITCDGPAKGYKPDANKRCGKVLDGPKKGVIVHGIKKIDPEWHGLDGPLELADAVPPGAYCWDCLIKLLNPGQDYESEYATTMRAYNDFIQESYEDTPRGKGSGGRW